VLGPGPCYGKLMSGRHLVTGGAGFIGANHVDRLLARGEEVVVYDNLSRPGSQHNLSWLWDRHGRDAFRLVEADVRDGDRLARAVAEASVVVHLAGQVAVTRSLAEPREDFLVNAFGTLNLLEAARRCKRPPIVVYASTNKVYGDLHDLRIVEEATRYRCAELPNGVPETRCLDLRSPYACSKGAADQYVRDYHRSYGLPTVVLRQSCVYGPRQFGSEDQGWVAWLAIAAVCGRPITIYGNGKQVRDLLWVDDLLDCFDLVVERIETAAGQVYNVGGGPRHTLSVWGELGPRLSRLVGCELEAVHGPWRAADQKVFVADIGRAEAELGWRPRMGVDAGLARLVEWVRENRGLIE